MSAPKITELGTQPIRGLLLKYALPGIIAMTASSLYNMVDSIFIGHGVGAMALSGLTVAKPFMDICAAFGSLVGVGASSLVAIKLGEKDYRSANDVLANVILLNVLLGALVMAVGLYWLEPILYAFGASDVTVAYARDYMEIILWGNILTHIYYGLNSMLRSIGHPKVAMFSTIVAVVANIILDPIFIFVLDMGVRGAALATVISQIIAVIGQLVIFLNPKEVIYFHRGIWRLKRDITMRALGIGMAPFLMHLAACFVVIVLNNQLKRYGGDMAIATFGLTNRFMFFFSMIVMGLNQGMQPIVGYNYGAKLYPRMARALKLTAMCATCVMGVLWLFGLLWPEGFIRLFTHDEVLIAQSIVPARVMLCTMVMVGFPMVVGNFYTSIGMSGKAIFLSLTRQVLFLIPCILVLPWLFQRLDITPIWGVWWSLPICDALASIMAAILVNRDIRKFMSQTS
ncbi:MAG: MATE family efflux transporter [Paludibacteraceae bacterium]|nr:MATE family efflux transporter [Paludibacteraceae bacterium]MBP3575428.1 MATE family efflux transporter [Paludibacteraceae bacterium]